MSAQSYLKPGVPRLLAELVDSEDEGPGLAHRSFPAWGLFPQAVTISVLSVLSVPRLRYVSGVCLPLWHLWHLQRLSRQSRPDTRSALLAQPSRSSVRGRFDLRGPQPKLFDKLFRWALAQLGPSWPLLPHSWTLGLTIHVLAQHLVRPPSCTAGLVKCLGRGLRWRGVPSFPSFWWCPPCPSSRRSALLSPGAPLAFRLPCSRPPPPPWNLTGWLGLT